jgi:hypothetical protein
MAAQSGKAEAVPFPVPIFETRSDLSPIPNVPLLHGTLETKNWQDYSLHEGSVLPFGMGVC